MSTRTVNAGQVYEKMLVNLIATGERHFGAIFGAIGLNRTDESTPGAKVAPRTLSSGDQKPAEIKPLGVSSNVNRSPSYRHRY